jgi:hypothetical protein
MPTADVSHTTAAVFSPRTASRRTKISPPPMNQIPDTILRRDPRRVERHVFAKHVEDPVLGHQHDQRGGEPDQGVRAQPGALLADLTLQPGRRRQHQRQAELRELVPALPGGVPNGGRPNRSG